MPIELNTPDALEYHWYPFSNGVVNFKVRAPNDAHLCLSGAPHDADPTIEIFIGGWGNSKSVIRRNKTKPEKAENSTPHVLNAGEFRGFWVRVQGGVVTVGREGEVAAFLSWQDPEPFYVNFVGVCTAWGASGSWIIEDGGQGQNLGWAGPGAALSQHTQQHYSGSGGSPCWVPATNGQVPPGAVQGGQDGEALYVARARHQGALIPGKLIPSHNVAYIPFAGGEHPHTEYEVLCGCSPQWIPVSGNAIPPQAVPAGESEDGEPLFVGRVHHEGSVTTGKVQPTHGVCYIPYGGQELAFDQYEILIVN